MQAQYIAGGPGHNSVSMPVYWSEGETAGSAVRLETRNGWWTVPGESGDESGYRETEEEENQGGGDCE